MDHNDTPNTVLTMHTTMLTWECEQCLLQTLEAFSILQPAFWARRVPPGQQRLDESARQHMHKLAGMYGKAGVILNGRSLEPLVDAPALEAQWERFHTIMTSWGSRLTGQQSITTAQAWQEVSIHPIRLCSSLMRALLVPR